MDIRRVSIAVFLVLALIFMSTMYFFVIVDTNGEDNQGINGEDNGGSEPVAPVGDISDTPPGINYENDELTIDSDELISNHRTELNNNPIRVEIGEPMQQRTLEKDGNQILIEEQSGLESQTYTDDFYVIERTERPGSDEIRYNAVERDISEETYTRSTLIQTIISNTEVVSYQEVSNGLEIELYTEEDIFDIAVEKGMDSTNEVSTTMIVNDEGVVVSFETTVIGNELGTLTTSSESYQVEQIGDVTVDRPGWVDTAENEVTLVSGHLDTINNWIILEHDGLYELRSGEQITVLEGDSVFEINVPERFGEGDVMYLSPQGTSDWDVSVNQRPSEGIRDIDEELIVVGSTSDGETSYFEVSFE